MKVAVVLTGHLRSWRQVYPNFHEKIVSRYAPDIFIHSWTDEGWWDPESTTGYVDGSDRVDVEEVSELYQPVGIELEDFREHQDQFDKRAELFDNSLHRKRNIISMFYKIKRGVDLMNASGNSYDMVIRMRPDLVFFDNLPLIDPDKFYTINHKSGTGKGTGDMFQAGSQASITKFGAAYDRLEEIYSHTDILCPHVITKYLINESNEHWQEFSINRTLMHTPAGQYQDKKVYLK